jgi:hypothetical protein
LATQCRACWYSSFSPAATTTDGNLRVQPGEKVCTFHAAFLRLYCECAIRGMAEMCSVQ